MSRIAYITNSGPNSGVGHRATEILKRLQKMPEFEFEEISLAAKPGGLPKPLQWITRGWSVRSDLRKFDLIDITNQSIGFMAKYASPSIVTVHDIIEILEPQSFGGGLIARYVYSGISKASHLICVSEYTAKTVWEYYGIPNEKITVILNGVGPEFHPIASFRETSRYQALLSEFKLPPNTKVVLYVGSDHPRKNVIGAVQAFAKVQEKVANVVFLKVGEPGLAAGRRTLLEEVDQLGIRDRVHFVGNVSLERLNELYNLAGVLLYPSRFEGFGLPPLQAMAAGTPVITSNSTSLPEVVGEAGIMHGPDDIEALAQSLERVLSDEQFSQDLRQKGLARAKQFSWDDAAKKVAAIYHKLL